MDICFGIDDYEEKCIKIYLSRTHVFIVKDLKEYDDFISQLQKIREEMVANYDMGE